MIDDEDFLLRVYASARSDASVLASWDAAERDAFVRMQWNAQARAYAADFPNASVQVVLVDGAPAGRLCVDRTGPGVHVVDLALLPEFRGRGVGTRLLRSLLDEASASGGAVTLSVERSNRAVRLYRRLGFNVVEDGEVYLRLEWRRPQVNTAS